MRRTKMKLELVVMPCRFCREDRVHRAMKVAYTIEKQENEMNHISAYIGTCQTCGNPNFHVFERQANAGQM
jgi:hypothetical protein